MSSSLLNATIALVVGLGIPIGATLNAGLAARMGSPAAAGLTLFLLGSAIALAAFLVGRAGNAPNLTLPPLSVFYFGGVFIAAYVLSITWLVPRFGIGNAVFFILLGQMIAAAALDHFGWFGVPRRPIDITRLIGIGVILFGVFLATKEGKL